MTSAVGAPSKAKPKAAASEPTPSATTEKRAGTPGKNYNIRIRALEERVGDLKEKVYRSKSRLMLLREQILHNVIAEAKAILVHRNDMSSFFTLEQVLYFLDGNKIYFNDNSKGELDSQREFEIFNGNILPGNHIVSVEMVYRGNGGLFSYVDGYRFKLKSSFTFYAQKGRIARVSVVGHERGGITTDLRDKPYISYKVRNFQYNKENLERLEEGEPLELEEDGSQE